MKPRACLLAVVACLGGGALARGQADKVFLRLEPGGPTSVLNAVAFSPDGERLYAAGYDKVVRVWTLNKEGSFEPSKIAYRVPIAPGLEGTINALAASPDGNWLAVGGLGVMRGRADFRTVGMVFPTLGAMTRPMLEDEGAIYVFDVNNERVVKVLRGHAGPVLALAFLPTKDGLPPLLVSAAEEPTGKPDEYAARVRLWDVSKATSLAEETIDTKLPRKTPGLAAWHTGAGAKDVAVAAAWSDGQVRVWDVARGQVDAADDGRNNNTAALLGEGQFLTAAFLSPNGVVRSWRAGDGRPPRLQSDPEVRLPPEDRQSGPFYLPRDLASFPSRNEGPVDRAVVLARRQKAKSGPDDEDLLLLLDLSGNRVLARRSLGAFRLNLRRLAASPTGKHVAVADADSRQVLVFSTADLAGQKEPQPQVLRGVGTSFQAASFRKKGDDPGLFLEEVGGTRMIFDFNRRRLLADDPAWRKDAPEEGGWDVSRVENDRGAAVTGPGFKAKTILLDEKSTITAAALLPPRKGEPFGPLLALGWLDEFRQSQLALYDLATGTQVRQLAGHAAAVRSLAFSGDGHLLASTADDQTVCLWTMTNLDQVLGKAGALTGVAVVQKGKDVEVARAPDGSPLQVGAVVEGLVEADKVRSLATPRHFYEAFFETKPDAEVVLRVRQPDAERATDVKLRVGQGTDEHKPLLSLFVTREGEPAKRQWIAWTSLGPYDASSRRAEDYLGWHFNPEKPEQPVDFARADKYRADYESQGLLEYLVRRGNTAKALEDWKNKPLPEMETSLDGVDPKGPRVADRPLVRARALTLRVELPRPFPVERVNAASWRLDDGAWRPLGDIQDRTWSADLSRLPWGRGPHVVGVRLETDGGRRQLDQTLAFHYLPERPRIEFAREWLRKNFPDASGAGLEAGTKEATFDLEAQVRPGTAGEEVRVAVRQGEGEPVKVDGADVRQTLTLKEGANVLEIRAVNAGASKDLEAEETAVRRIRVSYYRQRPAPLVSLREVAPVAEGSAPIAVRPGEAVTVSVPKVRVVGKVVGEENLEEVRREDQPLAHFEAGKGKQFDLDDEIALKPGEQVVHYKARTKDGPAGEASVRLVFLPPVAEIRSVRPLDGTKWYEKEAELQAELTPPGHKERYTAEVLVNDRRQSEQALDADSRVLKAKMTLDPGANRIVVKLHNQWGSEAVRELQIRYLRPPRIVKFDVAGKVDKAVVDFSAEVESPPELPPCEARVNGVLLRDDRLPVELLDRDKGLWKVTLRDVELKEGDNTLNLLIANKDDVSLKPGTARVRYDRPPPPPPVVKFRDFKDGEHYDVPAPQQALAFVVDSTTPLKRVELRGENDALLFHAEPGARKVEETERVRLKPAKPTTFRLIAVNEGGEAEASVTLQLPDRPAYVAIDRLEPLKAGGKPFLPLPDRNDGQGRAVFDVVTEGRVVLHGRIFWNDPNDERFRQKINLRVYANGFQQIPAEARPPKEGETECTFSATVLLTRAANNVIEVDLPDLKLAEGQRNACVVRKCTDPIRGRRLHLVVIGIDEKDGGALKQRALEAVGARRKADAEGRLEAPPAFEEVVAYDPLVGGVSKGQVINRLKGVKRQIQATAPEDQNVVLSEVVLVYYQGQEMVTPEGHFLLSDDFQGDEDLTRTGVSCANIVDLFGDARGVQVVMLDVERVARAKAEAEGLEAIRAFDGGRLGVFYSFWLGEKAPPARLLPLLQKGWSEANNLGDLAKQVDGLRLRLSPQMRFSTYLPGELAQLEFGGKR